MHNLDHQQIQLISDFLTTYGKPAGIAVAQEVGKNLGGGAAKTVQDLWRKIRHKSQQEGGSVEQVVKAFEASPQEARNQHKLEFIIEQMCDKDTTFAQEILQLFEQIQQDPVACHYIQNISSNAQVGIAGTNYAPVTIFQTSQQAVTTRPDYELKVELSEGFIGHQGLKSYPTLCVSVLNTGKMPSYISTLRFEVTVDGKTTFFQMPFYHVSQMVNKFGQAIPPGRSHTFNYIKRDLSQIVEQGQEIKLLAVIVRDEIGHDYRKEFTPEMAQAILNVYEPGYTNFL